MIYTCPECGQKSAMNNNICEHCGCKIKICPECGNIIKNNDTVCDYCGIACTNIQETKIEQKNTNSKELENCAAQMIDFTERANKSYTLTSTLLRWLAVIFVGIAFIMLYNFGNYESKTPEEVLESLLNVADMKNQIEWLLIGCIAVLVLAFIIQEFRTIFTAPKISRRIDEQKFDYISYYKNLKTYKQEKGGKLIETNDNDGSILLNTSISENIGTVQLIEAVRYRVDPSAKNPKILKKLFVLAFFITAYIFAYIGLNANIETYISKVILESAENFSFTFDFNKNLIIAVCLLVVGFIIDWILDSDIKDAMKWVQHIKTKNN